MTKAQQDASARPSLPRPADIKVLPDNIPVAMRERPQWVCWRWTWKPDRQKWDKPPFDAKTGQHASSTNPSTWSSLDEALAAYRDPANSYSGIGYVFNGEPGDFVGIDLDHCRDPETGAIQSWNDEQKAAGKWANAPNPQQIIDTLATYAEVSPSGTGVKLIAAGQLAHSGKAGDFEAYARGRYFTVTGHRLPSTPTGVSECNGAIAQLERNFFAERSRKSRPPSKRSNRSSPSFTGPAPTAHAIIERCRRATNGAKFNRLWEGDISDYPSQSEADLAFCSIIAFYTGPDEQLLDAIVRQSALFRDKWDEVHAGDGRTYGQMTIATALEGRTEYCQSKEASGQVIRLADLELEVTNAKRTASKTAVTVEIRKSGEAIDVIRLSDAASNRREAVKRLAKYVQGDTDAAEGAVAQLLVSAHQSTRDVSKTTGDLPTVREILKQHIDPALKLLYRIASGKAFSESLEDEINRSQFIERFTSNEMLDRCYSASDATTDDEGNVERGALLKVMSRELQLLWGDLIAPLRCEDETDLTVGAFAARQFRADILRLWSKPANFGINKHEVGSGNGPRESIQLASRTSLVSRVNRMRREGVALGKWHRIQEGYDAWLRIEEEEVDGGELVAQVYLAMRWMLADQIGVKLADVNRQKQLTARGKKYGAFVRKPKIAVVTSGGRDRLAVLSPALVEHLLASPEVDIASDVSGSQAHG